MSELTNVSGIISEIRDFLSDYKDVNELLGNKEEFTTSEIMSAIRRVLYEVNEHGPVKTTYTIVTCPKNLIYTGVVSKLLLSKIIVKGRNHVVINDGGTLVDKQGNIPDYAMVYNILNQEYHNNLSIHKVNLNIERAFN